jgi:myo-inositol 2-dehydrogenase / D-chiro-inositol 1-dehydrogenase
MTEIRVGLIGCGGVGGDVHLRLLRRMPGVTLAAVADLDPNRRLAAERAGVPTTADADALLSRSDIDAVVIAVPPAAHAAVASAALERGRHVYLEKPLAASLADGRAILDAWRQPGRPPRVGMVGFNYRFNPLVRKARRLLAGGAIGRPVAVRTVFSIVRRAEPAWRYSAEQGGGPLIEIASHHVDLIAYLFRTRIVDVAASCPVSGSEATVAVRLHLEDGLEVHSTFSVDGIDDDRIEVVGERGLLTVDRYRDWHVRVAGLRPAFWRDGLRNAVGTLLGSPHLVRKMRSPYHEPSYQLALRHFLDAIRGAHPASPDLADGYRTLEVIVGAAQSLTLGRPSAL